MLQDEKVKIYNLSKPIIDLLPNPIYNLNNSTYNINNKIYLIKNIQDIQLEITNSDDSYDSDNSDYCDNQEYLLTNINHTHPIYYYHSKYLTEYPVKYFDHDIFDNFNKSYQINYYLDELSNSSVKLYYNKNKCIPKYFYPMSKLNI